MNYVYLHCGTYTIVCFAAAYVLKRSAQIQADYDILTVDKDATSSPSTDLSADGKTSNWLMIASLVFSVFAFIFSFACAVNAIRNGGDYYMKAFWIGATAFLLGDVLASSKDINEYRYNISLTTSDSNGLSITAIVLFVIAMIAFGVAAYWKDAIHKSAPAMIAVLLLVFGYFMEQLPRLNAGFTLNLDHKVIIDYTELVLYALAAIYAAGVLLGKAKSPPSPGRQSTIYQGDADRGLVGTGMPVPLDSNFNF